MALGTTSLSAEDCRVENHSYISEDIWLTFVQVLSDLGVLHLCRRRATG